MCKARILISILAFLWCGAIGAIYCAVERSAPVVGSPVDVAPFAFVRTWKGPEIQYPGGVRLQEFKDVPRKDGVWYLEASPGETSVNIGLEWGEPREVKSLSFDFADENSVPDPAWVTLELWLDEGTRKGERPRQFHGARSPSQGKWYAVTSDDGMTASRDGSILTYTLPNVVSGIWKARILIPTGTPSAPGSTGEILNDSRYVVKTIRALVNAKYALAEFRVEFDSPRKKPQNIVEGYNAEVLEITPLANADGYSVKALASDAKSDSNDRAIFTIREGERSFSFLLNDLQTDRIIYVKPFGAKVCLPNSGPFVPSGQTITERVLAMPEQTYTNALNAIPPKVRNKWLALAPPLNPKKWAIQPNGDAFSREEQDFVYQWATGDKPDLERRESQHVENDCLPILYSEWEENGLHWQVGYVTTSLGRFDDPTADTALVMKATARNDGTSPIEARLWLHLHKGGKHVVARLDNGVLYEDDQLRGILDTGGWEAKLTEDRILFTTIVPPGTARSVELEAPWPTVTKVPKRIKFDNAKDVGNPGYADNINRKSS
ncbi:MAG: hypothetical protein ACPL7O_10265, partial [Armatimonadota bacterium]